MAGTKFKLINRAQMCPPCPPVSGAQSWKWRSTAKSFFRRSLLKPFWRLWVHLEVFTAFSCVRCFDSVDWPSWLTAPVKNLLLLSQLIMAALCNRAGYYIFALWFVSFFFFFFFFYSPNLSRRRFDVYHTWCGPSANLECRSEMCCTRLAGNTGHKKIAILAASHNFVGLYLRN